MSSFQNRDMTARRVSCIVPVYNEAKRICGVLGAVVGHPLISEVIVVDDGSTDETQAIVKAADGVRLITLDKNRGKSWALHVGLQEAASSLVILLDGDLIGLRASHVTALILPVLEGRADVSLSLRENTPRLWKLIGLDYITGERVFRKDLLATPFEELKALPKFGFEVYFNARCIEQKCRIAVVPWKAVLSPFKNTKYGLLKGILAELGMISDLLMSASPMGLLHQILAILRLRVELPAQ
jgi:glycosyltransferase involved in cell wall biosynthesis